MSDPKMREVKIKSYAKINLALDVIGMRDDGYHSLRTVMQKVGLADDITIRWQERNSDDFEIELSAGKPYLPTDERNLAYRAARIMAEKANPKPRGKLTLRITKRIPVAAGLGGGSANAAAVMTALNKLWQIRLNTWQLCELGAQLGADIPFLILVHNTGYECAYCEETGEKMTALKRGLRKYIVLAKPAFGVSTKEVFNGIDSCEIRKRPDLKALTDGLKTGEDAGVLPNMINVLEEYTLSHYDEVRKLKEKMKATAGVKHVVMSGSGPTVFAVYETYKDSKRACLSLREQGYEAYWTQTMKGYENRRKERC